MYQHCDSCFYVLLVSFCWLSFEINPDMFKQSSWCEKDLYILFWLRSSAQNKKNNFREQWNLRTKLNGGTHRRGAEGELQLGWWVRGGWMRMRNQPWERQWKSFFLNLHVKKTINIKQQRQELIWIIHMMKIILVPIEKSARIHGIA